MQIGASGKAIVQFEILLTISQTEPNMVHCAGLGWGRVIFLHSSWSGSDLWVCAGNVVDNIGMFLLLMRRAC